MSEETKVLTKEIAVQFLKEKGVSIPKEDEVAAPAGPYNYISRKNGKSYFLRRRTLKSEGKPDTVLHYFSEQGGPIGDLAGNNQPDEVLNAMPEKYTVGENDDTGLPMLMQKSTEPIDTTKYSSIDEAAAKLLALHWKEGLNLNGLKEISESLAQIFSRFKGSSLRLDSVADLSDSAAAALSSYSGDLSLNRIASLSDSAASALGRHEKKLSLNSLTKLSDSAAEALAKHKGALELNSLFDVSDAVKKALRLPEERTLTADVLRQCFAARLSIDTSKFSSIEPEAAAILASDTDTLSEGLNLSGLTELTETVASALAGAEASSGENARISLRGLKTISAPAAEALASCPRALDLSGLITLTEDVAEAFGRHEGSLYLDGLSELQAKSAAFLTRQKGLLSLSGLNSICDEAAAAFARDAWPVRLNIAVVVGSSPGLAALRAKIEEPTRFVEIGVTDEIAEFRGATQFKISWDLDWNIISDAGIDEGWAKASVMYDFATGRAWKFDILPELVEKGLAVPNLDADFFVSGPGDVCAKGGLANYMEMVNPDDDCESDFSPDQDTVVDIIRRVHTHALELIALKDTSS